MRYMYIFLFLIFVQPHAYTSVLSGKVADENNLPATKSVIYLYNAICSDLSTPLRIAKTDGNGNFSLSIDENGKYLLVVMQFGSDPLLKTIEVSDEDLRAKFTLSKCRIPEKIESVMLQIDGNTINIGRGSAKKIFLKKGHYSYYYIINNEVIPYYDLNNPEVIYEKGLYKSVINQEEDGEVPFRFAEEKYVTFDSRNIYNPTDWYSNKMVLEGIKKASSEGSAFLTEKLKTNKVVFLGEIHDRVNPVLFLTANIEKLYTEAGLRYLLLEGGAPDLGEMPLRFFLPWDGVGLRYEWNNLFNEINQINRGKNEQDKIKIIYPEDGHEESTDYSPEGRIKHLNSRDEYAYTSIKNIIDKSEKEDKILIFYGAAHGNKCEEFKEINGKKYIHYPFGYYLAKAGYQYYAINYDYYHISRSDSSTIDTSSVSENRYVFLRDYFNLPEFWGYEVNKFILDGMSDPGFDAFIGFRNYIYGTPFYAINVNDMAFRYLEAMKKISTEMKQNKNNKEYYSFLQNQLALTLNYLSACYPVAYTYWNNEKPLSSFIKDLEVLYRRGKFVIPDDTNAEIEKKKRYYNMLSLAANNMETSYYDAAYYLDEAKKLYDNDPYLYYIEMKNSYLYGEYKKCMTAGEKLTGMKNILNLYELPEIVEMYKVSAGKLHIKRGILIKIVEKIQ